MTKINISIPQPCHENWEAMTSVEKGKFCNSCQKKVFDFTKASDREIVNAFQQNQNLCGRFLNTQLNRDLIKPEKKNPLWLATTTALISLVGLNEITAQEPVKTEQRENDILGKVAPPKVNQNSIKTGEVVSIPEIEVSGVVSDESGTLPGAMIKVKGTEISTQTDFDGKFTIKVKKNDVLVIAFIGYYTKEIEILNSDKTEIMLNESDTMLGEMAVGGIQVKKRTFFGRLFHKNKYK